MFVQNNEKIHTNEKCKKMSSPLHDTTTTATTTTNNDSDTTVSTIATTNSPLPLQSSSSSPNSHQPHNNTSSNISNNTTAVDQHYIELLKTGIFMSYEQNYINSIQMYKQAAAIKPRDYRAHFHIAVGTYKIKTMLI